MKEAESRGYPVTPDYKHKDTAIAVPNTDEVYLNMDELMRMHQLNLSENPHLAVARDWFLLGAFTGQRFSDWVKISPEHLTEIRGMPCIRIVPEKTAKKGTTVTIPLHPVVKEVWSRNNNTIPREMPDQKINRYIKDIARLAGIDTEVKLVKPMPGGKLETVTVKKFDEVKTHTARRSFATNAYLAGAPIQDVMAVTGHTQEAMFLKYVRVTRDEKAKRLSENSFYTGYRNEEE